VSVLGTRVTSIAYPLLVLALTGSPAQAGVVGFAQSLPFILFYLPAGALVDRWNRKRVMLVSEAVRAVALGSIAVAIATGTTTLAQIVAIAFVEGSLFVFFRLSESSALPRIVAREQLPTAIAQNQAREQGADLAGQPLGGALFALGHAVPFLFDAVSYAVSFVSLLFIRPAFQEEREPRSTRLLTDIKEGVSWLWHEPFLRVSVLLLACTNFVFSAISLALIVRAQDLGASPSRIGVMLAFGGAGALLGSAVAPWIHRRMHPKIVVIGALWMWAIIMPIIAAVPSALAIGAIWGVAAIAGPVLNVSLASYRYALVPDRMLARVQSAALVVAWGAVPLGQLAAGLLLQGAGAVKTIVLLAAINGVTAVLATGARSIRSAPDVKARLAETA
jgi:predicted MFS family arabinose efflux permease